MEFKLTIAGGDEHAVSWPAGSGCPHGLPPRLREGLFEMRKGETCSFLLPKDAPGVDYEVTLVSWVENEECVSGDDGAVVKRIERDKTIGKDDWKCPQSNFMHDLDTVHMRGPQRCGSTATSPNVVDYTGARRFLRGRVWVDGRVEERRYQKRLSMLSMRTWRRLLVWRVPWRRCGREEITVVGEISTAIIRKDYGFKDGPLAGQHCCCRLELVKIEPQTPNWEIKTTDLKIEAVNAPRRGNQSLVAVARRPAAMRRDAAASTPLPPRRSTPSAACNAWVARSE